MRTLFAIAALVLLASCADSPTKPTTSGGSSSGSGKIVTATPEEPFDCDDDLILEPHLPEECIPPEPPEPVVQKPVEPPKPDPIVGTYHVFFNQMPERQVIYRIYADGRAVLSKSGISFDLLKDQWNWEKDGGWYHFYWFANYWSGESSPAYRKSLKYQSVSGEPDIVVQVFTDIDAPSGKRLSRRKLMPWIDSEGIKLSDDPDFATDLYVLGSNDRVNWSCFNLGRKEIPHYQVPRPAYEPQPPDFARSEAECRLLCRPAIEHYFSKDPKRLREGFSLNNLACH